MQKNKTEIVEKFARHEGDTGSPEVQCAIWTQSIKELTEHMKVNPKDFQSLRGLLTWVNKRKRSLKYLKTQDTERYQTIIKALGIRG
jgi:small subunit ribosomal protein S15